jgi:hypothetical protein
MSRDYLNVKIWDVNMESKPVVTYNIHDYLKSKLVDLYENDCIFDKFECAWSGDDRWVTSRYRFRATSCSRDRHNYQTAMLNVSLCSLLLKRTPRVRNP